MEEDLLALALDSVSAVSSDKHLLNIIQCGASVSKQNERQHTHTQLSSPISRPTSTNIDTHKSQLKTTQFLISFIRICNGGHRTHILVIGRDWKYFSENMGTK